MDTIWVAISNGDSGTAPLAASKDRTTAMSAAVVEAVHLGYDATPVRDALAGDHDATWDSDDLALTLTVQQTEVR
jgi:hypothetical protein